MTNERQENEIVSASYREIATETTPVHLDDTVLRMAANKAQHPHYSRAMTWTRPLAWAATIALCLAITLEVTRGPVPDAIVSEADLKESLPEVASPASAVTMAPQKLEQAEERPAAASAEDEFATDARSKRVADEPRRDARSRDEAGRVEAESPGAFYSLAPLEFEVKDAEVMQHVEDLARLQSGTINEPMRCSEEAKTKPESWLTCIEAFKDAGNSEAARREEEALIAVFPDFKLP